MTAKSLLEDMNSLLEQVRLNKKAEANHEPGGHREPTSHPSKDVDDRTDDAEEGSQSAETARMVDEEQGEVGADNVPDRKPEDDKSLRINMDPQTTGKTPEHETSSVDDTKEDPGTQRGETEHPARTDNKDLDGKKFAELLKKAEDANQEFLANVAVLLNEDKKDGEKVAEKKEEISEKKAEEEPEEKPEEKTAEEAGHDLAGLLHAIDSDEKVRNKIVKESLETTIREAFTSAEKVAACVKGYAETLKEHASKEAADKKEEKKAAVNPNPAPLPPEAAGAAQVPGEEEAALLAALLGGGGQDIGAEEALTGMGAGAGPEEAMGAGLPGEDAGPEEAGLGAEGTDELALLEAALAEAGISPEELEALLAPKLASAAKELVKSGAAKDEKSRWQPKTAKEKKKLQATIDYVKELASR